jgi:small subunit ribosomal protein S2
MAFCGKESYMAMLSMKSLIESGVHYGHLARKWNPKMKPYIFGIRNDVHIINLQHTIETAKEAGKFAYTLGKEGKTLLFVGTKKQAQDIVAEEAAKAGAFYVTERWLGGTLTNFDSIRNIAVKYQTIHQTLASEEGRKLSKRDRAKMEKEAQKLFKYCKGVLEMNRVPDAIFLVDVIREQIARQEARAKDLPIIALVDTNTDPDGIAYPIPSNDDALKSIALFIRFIADSFSEGRQVYQATLAQQAKEEKKGKDESTKTTGTTTKESGTPEGSNEENGGDPINLT